MERFSKTEYNMFAAMESAIELYYELLSLKPADWLSDKIFDKIENFSNCLFDYCSLDRAEGALTVQNGQHITEKKYRKIKKGLDSSYTVIKKEEPDTGYILLSSENSYSSHTPVKIDKSALQSFKDIVCNFYDEIKKGHIVHFDLESITDTISTEKKGISRDDTKPRFFKESDFDNQKQLQSLCNKIAGDNYGIATSPADDYIKWLNELLQIKDFYQLWEKRWNKKLGPSYDLLIAQVERDCIYLNSILIYYTYEELCPDIISHKPDEEEPEPEDERPDFEETTPPEYDKPPLKVFHETSVSTLKDQLNKTSTLSLTKGFSEEYFFIISEAIRWLHISTTTDFGKIVLLDYTDKNGLCKVPTLNCNHWNSFSEIICAFFVNYQLTFNSFDRVAICNYGECKKLILQKNKGARKYCNEYCKRNDFYSAIGEDKKKCLVNQRGFIDYWHGNTRIPHKESSAVEKNPAYVNKDDCIKCEKAVMTRGECKILQKKNPKLFKILKKNKLSRLYNHT